MTSVAYILGFKLTYAGKDILKDISKMKVGKHLQEAKLFLIPHLQGYSIYLTYGVQLYLTLDRALTQDEIKIMTLLPEMLDDTAGKHTIRMARDAAMLLPGIKVQNHEGMVLERMKLYVVSLTSGSEIISLIPKPASSEAAEKSMKHPTTKSRLPEPKKRMYKTAYVFYMSEQRPIIKQQHPEMTSIQLVDTIFKGYQRLPLDDRKHYNKLSEQDRKDVKREYKQKLAAMYSESDSESDTDSESESDSGSYKKPSMNKKPSMKKKSLLTTPYEHYVMQHRDNMLKTYPKLSFTELYSKLDSNWRRLSAAEQQPYINMSKR